MLSKPWDQRKSSYHFIIVGSGYGGSILASRLAHANFNPRKSVCLLERGKEWEVGKFPDNLLDVTAERRDPLFNPLGLYDFLPFRDISVIQGSGLGGTSLVNANVVIDPDEEVFEQMAWPGSISKAELRPFFDKATQMLAATVHPRGNDLLKVKALDRRAREISHQARSLELAVNFSIDGPNPHGVPQKPCIDCGDCVTGCNVGAKNTVYMNYLPMAAAGGTDIFVQVQVDWVEKVAAGGWRVHGRRFRRFGFPEKFTLNADHVILSAGSLGTSEILLRSESKGLRVSPRLGTGFSGNGDFFGLAYNSDEQTNVLGFGADANHPWRANAPGPTIVGGIRYYSNRPYDQRITVEDLSFPKAYLGAAMVAFGAMLGEDTDVGDETEEQQRRLRNNPIDPYQQDNAMNHTMMYLVMGHDDAKGNLRLKTNFFDTHGRIEIDWDEVGRQPMFTRINEELRRHTRTLGGYFLENPAWAFVNLRNLITAHPLGGCPLGENHLAGAVDEFGRVFNDQGGIHDGLLVADGSVIPSALGVNPLLTISALAERSADRLVRSLQGDPYPAPAPVIPGTGIDPIEVSKYKEADLERLFGRVETKSTDVMINTGQRTVDHDRGIIRNDTVWKGYFPRRHVLNQISTALATGFKKRFFRTDKGLEGMTSDTDGRINARNTLEEFTISKREGSLDPGRYILLRYTDPPWNIYYDIFKVVNDDLLIGRVYLGEFPRGVRIFTFPMTRTYRLDEMTAQDHRSIYDASVTPTKDQLDGLWEMRTVSNANPTGVVAYLKFDDKPDGRLEARYRFLGLIEGQVQPVFGQDHFQLNDFTPFHDEIRRVSQDFMVGKYTTAMPSALSPLFGDRSLGLFHPDESAGGTQQLSFFYTLTRSGLSDMPPTGFLAPLLDLRLPEGLGMTFDEEMVGQYFPGFSVPGGREGDLQLENKSAADQRAVDLSFQVRMSIADLNEFLESPEHEAGLSGSIHFRDFEGRGEKSFLVDEGKSGFHYLRINPQTEEAEMVYLLYFNDEQGKHFFLQGRKYMQKDLRGGIVGVQEILHDYTTLYCHLSEADPRGKPGQELGTGLLKFRTFEDIQAVGSFIDFLLSFQVTGTNDLLLKAQGQARFLAFTNHFVMREYDPLTVEGTLLADEIREAVVRGSEERDHFSSRPSSELQDILRETPSQPLEKLLNRGNVEIDYENHRIWRDSFWKGSFAKDTLLGWQERIRNAALEAGAEKTARLYTGGTFWKRFEAIVDGAASGHVVNYELQGLPGKPEVRRVSYPDNNRKYFKQGDDVLLLTYKNDPYKLVYDTIKVIDENNCLGVMHLGDFPNGVEVATFVMARHNYPFDKMSVPDHQAIFSSDRVRVPTISEASGEWQGHLIFLTRPDISLLNQFSPAPFSVRFLPVNQNLAVRFQFSPGQELERIIQQSELTDELRLLDNTTMIGRWTFPSDTLWLQQAALGPSLQGFLEPGRDIQRFYFFLTRV